VVHVVLQLDINISEDLAVPIFRGKWRWKEQGVMTCLYPTTTLQQCLNPEDNLNLHCHENLKFHNEMVNSVNSW